MAELEQWLLDNVVVQGKIPTRLNEQWLKSRGFADKIEQIYQQSWYFLPSKYVSLRERVANILDPEGVREPKYCVCGKQTAYLRGDFQQFCSKKCANTVKGNDPSYKEKKRQTLLEKYGVDNPGKLGNHLTTVKERYGVDNPRQIEGVSEKIKQTNLERYGATSFLTTELGKRKSKQSMIDLYQVDHPMRSTIFVERKKSTSLERYGHQFASSSEAIKSKIKDTVTRKYGDKHFNLKDRKGLTVEFLWNLYNSEGLTLEEISAKIDHYFSADTIGQILKKTDHRLRSVTKTSSHERAISQFLTSLNIEHRTNIRDFLPSIDGDRRRFREIDILIPSHKLAIEINGAYWHSSEKKTSDFHRRSWDLARQLGYQMLQFWDIELIETPHKVQSIIKTKLGLNDRIYARQCQIRQISSKQAKEFCNMNHIQGFASAKVHIGLFNNERLVEYMSFSKPRFDKSFQWELIRNCSEVGISVVGGSSRLFKYFVTNFKPQTIISYCNLRLFTGSMYQKLGFSLERETKPNFSYYVDRKIESRQKYQKSKLPKLLEVFDPFLSEERNMELNGHYRLYDCGNGLWTWENSIP